MQLLFGLFLFFLASTDVSASSGSQSFSPTNSYPWRIDFDYKCSGTPAFGAIGFTASDDLGTTWTIYSNSPGAGGSEWVCRTPGGCFSDGARGGFVCDDNWHTKTIFTDSSDYLFGYAWAGAQSSGQITSLSWSGAHTFDVGDIKYSGQTYLPVGALGRANAGLSSFAGSAITMFLYVLGIALGVFWSIIMVKKVVHWFIELMNGKGSTLDESNVRMKGIQTNKANDWIDPKTYQLTSNKQVIYTSNKFNKEFGRFYKTDKQREYAYNNYVKSMSQR